MNSWPVHGYTHDVLVGGLYPGTQPEGEYGILTSNFEVAVPITQANKFLKRVRELFDEAAAEGKAVTLTYRRCVRKVQPNCTTSLTPFFECIPAASSRWD